MIYTSIPAPCTPLPHVLLPQCPVPNLNMLRAIHGLPCHCLAGASERLRLATLNETLRADMDRVSKECVHWPALSLALRAGGGGTIMR